MRPSHWHQQTAGRPATHLRDEREHHEDPAAEPERGPEFASRARKSADRQPAAGPGSDASAGPETTDDETAAAPAAGAQIARDPHIQTPKPKIRELKRLLRHTNSLSQLPEFGVETQHEPQLGQLIEQIDVWGLNIFEVHKYSQEHSLTVIMYKVFKVSMGLARREPSAPHAPTACRRRPR